MHLRIMTFRSYIILWLCNTRGGGGSYGTAALFGNPAHTKRHEIESRLLAMFLASPKWYLETRSSKARTKTQRPKKSLYAANACVSKRPIALSAAILYASVRSTYKIFFFYYFNYYSVR